MTEHNDEVTILTSRVRHRYGHLETFVTVKDGDDVQFLRKVRLDDLQDVEVCAEELDARFNGRTPGKDKLRQRLLNKAAPDSPAPGAGTDDDDEEEDARPWLDVSTGDLSAQTRELYDAIAETNNPPTLLRYGNAIARIQSSEEDGAPVVHILDLDGRSYEIAERVRCYKPAEDGSRTMVVPQRAWLRTWARRGGRRCRSWVRWSRCLSWPVTGVWSTGPATISPTGCTTSRPTVSLFRPCRVCPAAMTYVGQSSC